MDRSLPIWQVAPAILDALRAGNRLVLAAPTGSGKSTQVPQMLVDELALKRVVVLQPRRVAARTLATRVAQERKAKLGGEVGYQIRFEDYTSRGTKISFVTEGILLRWLQDDSLLAGIDAIVFDEFHERNLLSDLALGLVKRLQAERRSDLKMIVMSATLDTESVAKYLEGAPGVSGSEGQRSSSATVLRCEKPLTQPSGSPSPPQVSSPPGDVRFANRGPLLGEGKRAAGLANIPADEKGEFAPHVTSRLGAPVVVSEGTMFAVEVSYLDYMARAPVPELAAQAVEQIINSGESGDILVFMPGMGEIQGTIAACRGLRINERIALLPLHGELPSEEQDRAFEESAVRKVIVSTNVAETSVTIPGIRHVVDSGLARVARYDAERGVGTLLIEEISRASADQRKGRAGRTAPGTCRRLWTESNHLNRPERHTPEIQRADLAEVVLLLHSVGVRRAGEFDWLDRPDATAIGRAEELLKSLGAIAFDAAAASDLTEIGRKMLRLPMHPRYSRMLVEAARYGCVREAALCAALVSGRDLLIRLGRDDQHIAKARENFEVSDQSDFFVLMEAFKHARANRFEVDACRRYGVHAMSAQQVAVTWQQIYDIARRHLNAEEKQPSAEDLQKCILTGFVDQFAVRKDQGTLDCLLTGRRTGTLMRESVVQKSPQLVVGTIREVSGKGGNLTLLGLATAVKVEWLRESFPEQFSEVFEHTYDRTHKRVAAIRYVRFHDLVVAQEHQKELDPAASGAALAEAHLEGLFELPQFTHDLKQFIARVNLVAKAAPELEFPIFDRGALGRALARGFRGLSLAKEAQAAPLKEAIHKHLAPEQIGWLDELAPTAISLGGPKPVKLQYAEFAPADPLKEPELQLKMHECFGILEHPKICEGKVPVRIWLCSPEGKRLQSTTNWPEFRAKEYPKLKPTLQKRFPGFTWL